ncbi:MAG: histidine kinase dimerization/phosphoacceptor domain -containing protein [bacterium]
MRISTKLKLAASVPALMALAIGLVFHISYRVMEKMQQKSKIVLQIMNGANELNSLALSTTLYHEDQMRAQFLTEHDTVTGLIATLRLSDSGQRQLLENIRRSSESMKDLFLELVSTYEIPGPVENTASLKGAKEEALAGRVLALPREITKDALRLESLIDDEITTTQRRTAAFVFFLIVIITLPLTAVLIHMMKNISTSLATLSKGVKIITAGNLTHHTGIAAGDEIGELSRAFDLMTEQLQATTVSRNALSKEVEERKRAEEYLYKESRETEFANRVLQVFVKEAGDELYGKILDIVLERMESEYGVFGYVDENGDLICPTMSKIFDQCDMAQKCICYPAATWKGLWGRALLEKRTLYSNEPAVVPDGHVPIRRNLAAPILFQGTVIGLLNLANKETDYTEKDREFIEAIANRIAPVLYAQIQKEMRENERRRAEEALRESREDLNRAQAVAQTGSWRLDVRRNVLLWSDENHRIFGIPRGMPMTYEAFLAIVHPEDRQYVDEKWMAGLRGEPYDIEHRLVVGDTIKWVRERAELEFDADGVLKGGFGTTQDITGKKRAEEALRESEERYRRLFTNMTEGFALGEALFGEDGVPKDYRFLELNDAFEHQSGLKREAVVARPMTEVLPNLERSWIDTFCNVALTGKAVRFENYSRDTNRHYDVFCYRPDEGRFAIIFRDITRQKQAEKELHQALQAKEETLALLDAIFDSAPIGLGFYDKNLRFVRLNQALADINGLPIHEHLGKTVDEIVPDVCAASELIAKWRRILETGQPMINVEISGSTPAHPGEIHHWVDNWYPVTVRGQIIGLAVTVSDITGRKQAEEQIKRSLREKEVLLKEIHHRVKNNLQIIHSMLNLQLPYIRDEQAIATFKESQNRIYTMALIHEKLYQSRSLARVDVAEYIRSLVTSLFLSYGVSERTVRPDIKVENVTIGIDTVIPCALIINELVSNSLKYAFLDSPQRTGRMGEIRIDLRRAGGNKYLLTVGDNGVGLPEGLEIEKCESLGLRLVHVLVKQLKGTLQLGHPDKGGGTEFTITFETSFDTSETSFDTSKEERRLA